MADPVRKVLDVVKANIKQFITFPKLPSLVPTDSKHATPKGYVDSQITTAKSDVLALINNTPKRHTVVMGKVDSNNRANFIAAGAGLAATLQAASTNFLATIANGYDSKGALNYPIYLTADQTFSGLTANSTNYLYLDYNSVTGVVTYGADLIGPTYSRLAPSINNGSIQHFDGTNGATSTQADVYPGNNWTLTNSTISTSASKFGGASLSLNGSTGYATNTGVILPGSTNPWTIEGWANSNSFGAGRYLVGSAGSNITTIFGLDSATSLRWGISSDGSSVNLFDSNIVIPSASTGTWYHWAIQFTGSNYQSYWNGTRYHNVSSSTAAFPFNASGNSMRLGVYNTSFFNGFIDEFRYTNNAAVYSGASITVPTAVFSGTNPTFEWFDVGNWIAKTGNIYTGWTNRKRVYIGEAVTDASTVTSVVSYALNGEYESPVTDVSGGNNYDFTDNLGCDRKKFTGERRGSSSLVWTPFDRYSSAVGPGTKTTSRNASRVSVPTNVGDSAIDGADSFSSSPQTTGQVRILIERAF